MRKGFYPRLAAQSGIKNGKFTFPYLLTVIGSAAAFYIMLALNFSGELPEMTRYQYLTMFFTVGILVLGLFNLVFLFYTNSFLIKRRKKELGLYNVLGMGKGNIALVLCFESLYTWLLGVGIGTLLGMLLQKLVTLVVQRVTRGAEMFAFRLSGRAVLWTAVYFGVVLLLTLIKNLLSLRLQKPVELLRGQNMGEREPKTKWLLVILGIGSLGAGYYIAVTTSDALRSIEMYFVAVLLVIIGTYCLFTAVSIAVLKLLRRNKRLYYQTPHFIGISGMLHRMKRNAVGLANLCILATMVLVMVSVTLSLYVGTEEALHTRYPAQLNFTLHYDPEEGIDRELVEETLSAAVEKQGLPVTEIRSYTDTAFGMERTKDGYRMSADLNMWSVMVFLPAWGYNNLTGESVSLEPGQLLTTAPIPEDGVLRFTFVNPEGEERSYQFEAASIPDYFTIEDYGISTTESWFFILPGDEELNELAAAELWTRNTRAPFTYFACGIDTDGSVEQQIACANALRDAWGAGLTGEENFHWLEYRMEGREWNREEYYVMNGGFFFLGIFLGILFLMAMVLIIYYKQISEGYEDRERFAIMQQVGLEKREIRRSINLQVLVVFFAPLLIAGVHVIFDFNLVSLLMQLFSMTNRTLAAWCTLVSFAAFAGIYALVYVLTARVYYRIVSE